MSKRLRLTRAARAQIAAIREVLRPWGLQSEIVNEGPHPGLKITGPRGGVWRLLVASSPRDEGDAVQTAAQKAQRLVREINGRLGL
ncbi:hypothetical protein [Phenylobacterium sp. SCN 70-31]|uniref:hypothetical protein n=1 Tax=Phenylobacterium sp. SCN 70-31 TaxID=1660129 RepID=UPI00086DC255|nr:hypothetical protein [Phenylobacterium sp. SCN 70-31]ODT88126.1 MAG: hypothetical protein ABS78_09550 [Phenylobacterium sp. SCN 70-31]